MTTTFPPKPWTEGDTFTNDTTGVGYTYEGGKWLASGGPKVDGEFVSKKGGDSMEGPLTMQAQNPADGRATNKVHTLGVFSNSDGSALRLGTTRDRVYIGNNDTSFNGLVKIDTLEQKGSNGIKINSDTSIQQKLEITADKVEYQKHATSASQLEIREVINVGILDNLMRNPTDGFLAGLATEEYVDDAIENIDIPDAGGSFNPGDQVAKTNGTSVEVGGFYVTLGNLYVRVS